MPIEDPQRLLELAMEYANSTNAIEKNGLSKEEILRIYQDILEGKKDESFLYSLIQYMKEHEGEQHVLHRR
jgi:hypothetical protein